MKHSKTMRPPARKLEEGRGGDYQNGGLEGVMEEGLYCFARLARSRYAARSRALTGAAKSLQQSK